MDSAGTPFISVIIPTRNRPEALRECLAALAGQDYPPGRFEVIIVDDESTVSLEQIVSAFRDQLDVTFLRQPRAGCGPGRNKGTTVARGSLLAFTDDDALPRPDWLSGLAQQSVAAPAHAIGGRTVNALPDNIYSTASQMLIDVLYEHYNRADSGPRFFAGNNLAVPAEGFRKLGGFDPGFHLSAAEDRDLCQRWISAGGRMIYAPQAVVCHAHKLNLKTFCRQHFNYGRGAYRYYQVRRGRKQGPTPFEPGLYPRLLRAPFASAGFPRACALAGLLILSQVAHTAGYVREMMGVDRAAPPSEC
jgi:GT2 family glycosyltransferase